MKAALCLFLLLGVVGVSFAVECYSCNYGSVLSGSGDQDNCADPFEADGIAKTTCNGQCSKSITKSDGKTLTATRSCSPACIAVDCTGALGIEACFTCCDGDLCNSAGPLTFSLVAMVAMVVSAWTFSQ